MLRSDKFSVTTRIVTCIVQRVACIAQSSSFKWNQQRIKQCTYVYNTVSWLNVACPFYRRLQESLTMLINTPSYAQRRNATSFFTLCYVMLCYVMLNSINIPQYSVCTKYGLFKSRGMLTCALGYVNIPYCTPRQVIQRSAMLNNTNVNVA